MKFRSAATDQSGFAVVMVLTLIAIIALVTLFGLEKAKREQQLANIGLENLQIRQTCLSLGKQVIRLASQTLPGQWSSLQGEWCLNNNAQLHNSCPGSFATVTNTADLRYSLDVADHLLTAIVSAARSGLSCKEKIIIRYDTTRGKQLVESRLFVK